MKVIVAKMPGGKAISVTLDEGATIKDAIAAANLEGSTNGGFEIRKNDNPASLSDTVAHQDIIALTQKIKGNAKNVVTLQFLYANGNRAESIEVLKTFPLNPAKLFTDVDDDNERLTVEGYILSNSDKDEYDPADYLFAVVKEDKPLTWKPLTNRNWLSSGCIILVRDAKADIEAPVKEEKHVEEAKTCKCEADVSCDCGDTCKCENAESPKLSPSPELISELITEENPAPSYATMLEDFERFSEYIKEKYINDSLKVSLSLHAAETKENGISFSFFA